jgi:hypothetical protein
VAEKASYSDGLKAKEASFSCHTCFGGAAVPTDLVLSDCLSASGWPSTVIKSRTFPVNQNMDDPISTDRIIKWFALSILEYEVLIPN